MAEKSSLKLWTVAEVRDATGLSARQIRNMIAEKKLKAVRVGTGFGSLRVPNAEVLKLAAGEEDGVAE